MSTVSLNKNEKAFRASQNDYVLTFPNIEHRNGKIYMKYVIEGIVSSAFSP